MYQDNWRWCNKCQGLAYAGNLSLGACPAGGTHDHSGSGNYINSCGILKPFSGKTEYLHSRVSGSANRKHYF